MYSIATAPDYVGWVHQKFYTILFSYREQTFVE